MQSGSRRRIRTLYVLAWTPLVALYTLAISAEGTVPVDRALVGAFYYILPPAVLGVGVIYVCRATPWSGEHWIKFLAKHVGAWIGFAGLTAALTVALVLLVPLQIGAAEGESITPSDIAKGQLLLGSLIYFVLVGLTHATLGEIRSRQQAAAAARADALRAQAELKALRAQVNPHFLFNTLHSLLALVRRDTRAAEEALEQFGDLMRYALRVQQEVGDEVLLADEWAFAQDYLALEKLRLGDRLQVHTDIDDEALAYSVPSFSLQPLLENSIGHGVAPRAGGGNLWIRAAVDAGRLKLEVRDDGPGADEATIEASTGTGLRLLRRRLAALHGNAAALTTRSGDEGFTVTVEVPAARGNAPEDGHQK